MSKFEQFGGQEINEETTAKETEPKSVKDEILENNPELAAIYEKRSGKDAVIVNEEGKIVREGHAYENIPHMRSFIELADAIREHVPEVQSGYVRLWRGNRQNEVGHNPSYTNSLEGIALPFLRGYGGVLSYVDIPEEEEKKYVSTGAVAPDSEFILPAEIVKDAKIVGFTPEQELEIKSRAKPEPAASGDGWSSI
jgi:hypothetical protein